MSLNLYDAPQNGVNSTNDASLTYNDAARQRQRRNLLLCFALGWTGLIFLTSTYADNLRYMTSVAKFIGYASLIGVGNAACLISLYVSVRGWWHLLVLPIWFFSITELLILILYSASAAALIHIKPWSERARDKIGFASTPIVAPSSRPFGTLITLLNH